MNGRSAVAACLCVAALLSACASPTTQPDLRGLLPAPLLLLSEQHDAPEHQALQRATVIRLAEQGALAAVVLEMVEQGRQTTGLPPEARVRDALDWRDEANSGNWPWAVYGPVVLGSNLPRPQMRQAMADATLDASLPPLVLQSQREAIRDGHCGLLHVARRANRAHGAHSARPRPRVGADPRSRAAPRPDGAADRGQRARST